MKNILLIAQIIISLILVVLILLQTSPETSNRSVSLIRPKFSRRGIEKVTFIFTLVLLGIFIGLSFFQLLL
jgi:protein translocase SecG subunit